MKAINLILAAIALAFSAPTHAKADAALDTFKVEMKGHEAYAKAEEAALKDNPRVFVVLSAEGA